MNALPCCTPFVNLAHYRSAGFIDLKLTVFLALQPKWSAFAVNDPCAGFVHKASNGLVLELTFAFAFLVTALGFKQVLQQVNDVLTGQAGFIKYLAGRWTTDCDLNPCIGYFLDPASGFFNVLTAKSVEIFDNEI
ncbi:hypothetical protein AX777_06020 [Sphingobium yanoikuyae]|uniref:Uncharacterized protein n=1 Tax=Sphingobium yanoikuyae TaxID=13690 RepID=A0A177JPR5_SPHYA|nr:hypothetical protein AX777_06020 [Sphingobium yanoikuyae]